MQQKPVLGARKIILYRFIPFWSLYKEYCKYILNKIYIQEYASIWWAILKTQMKNNSKDNVYVHKYMSLCDLHKPTLYIKSKEMLLKSVELGVVQVLMLEVNGEKFKDK